MMIPQWISGYIQFFMNPKWCILQMTHKLSMRSHVFYICCKCREGEKQIQTIEKFCQ